MSLSKMPSLAAGILVGLVLVMAEPSGRAGETGQQMPPRDTLLQQFKTIAFKSEFGGAHRRGRLIKWTGPIYVELTGDKAEQYRLEISEQLAQLARLTGLNIELVIGRSRTEQANLVIRFVARPGGFDRNAACTTTMYDRNFVITRAEITITSHIPDLRRHCIAEEITQALGIANDSEVLKTSIFNDWSRQLTLSPWDALMVRLLYDQHLRPGMTEAEAMPLVRQNLTQLLAGRRGRQALRR